MTWLFDLDNTLYPYSTGIYAHINQLMNVFLQKELNLDLEEVNVLREKYVKTYGTTLLGMMIHHQTNPDIFLKVIHSFTIETFLRKEPGLFNFLQNLPGKKYIFTNSPSFYAKNVLACLGIESLFESIFSIETFGFHGKPNPVAYRKVIETLKTNEIIHFVDDEPTNVETAKLFNFRTYWINSRKEQMNAFYEEELFLKLREE